MVSDRAHLKGARIGAGLSRLTAEVERILAVFQSHGAVRVEPEVLQPSGVLLDLYGEDIRARAFVTADEGAEMMLRPDFTVPIVRLHMDSGAEPARYAYCGPVWRRREAGSGGAREYLQAGVEIFQAEDPAATDAEVLSLMMRGLGDAPVNWMTGDMGLVLAAIDALATSAARKAALRRHVWRPAKFHRLLRRYGVEQGDLTARRADLLEAEARGSVVEMVAAAGAVIGLRGVEEVAARVAALALEAATPALSAGEVEVLEAVLSVRGGSLAALARFRELAGSVPELAVAVDGFEARLGAIEARGIAVKDLPFEASFGRTELEYYDGFVFGAMASSRADLPPIASGGRYDGLTKVLGRGRGIPAVGGIIRPEALVSLVEGRAWD